MIYGYIRVSTDTQDVENQKIGIETKAQDFGLSVDQWVSDDGVSGTKEPEKRQLGGLLKKVQPGDVIIISELSRLGRKLFMIMRILEGLMKADVKLYTVKDGYELGDNITSKVLAFAFGLAAEIERDLISQRTKEALARKKAEGVVLGRPRGQKNKSYKLDQHKEQILELLDKNIGHSGIARIIGVHRSTVSDYISHLTNQELQEKEEDSMQRAKENRGKFTLENIDKLREKGLSTQDIARFYGMSSTTLYKNIKKINTTDHEK